MDEKKGLYAPLGSGSTTRKTVDYKSSYVEYMRNRVFQRDYRDHPAVLPTLDAAKEHRPLNELTHNPSYAFCTKYVTSSTNHFNNNKASINASGWTPDSKSLVTCSHKGEISWWNGQTSQCELTIQGHDHSIKSLKRSPNDEWMITSDTDGVVKYWSSKNENTKAFKAHKQAVNDLAFSPTSYIFATASDDQSISIWNFEEVREEQTLIGHAWDVKSVDWHATKGLVVSGSRDSTLKLWDPKSGTCLNTFVTHKAAIIKAGWAPLNENWLLSASKDHLIKLWDVRMMKEIQTYKCPSQQDITGFAWHPVMETLFCSSQYDGSVFYWLASTEDSTVEAEITDAHDSPVTSMAWHPLGHLLATSGRYGDVRFWVRNRPGDDMKDKFNVNQLPVDIKTTALAELDESVRASSTFSNGKIPTALKEFRAKLFLQTEKIISIKETNQKTASSSTHIPGFSSSSSI